MEFDEVFFCQEAKHNVLQMPNFCPNYCYTDHMFGIWNKKQPNMYFLGTTRPYTGAFGCNFQLCLPAEFFWFEFFGVRQYGLCLCFCHLLIKASQKWTQCSFTGWSLMRNLREESLISSQLTCIDRESRITCKPLNQINCMCTGLECVLSLLGIIAFCSSLF